MTHLKKLLFLALALQLVNSQTVVPSKKANEGDYPHQVQLRKVKTKGKDPEQHCGGAILNTYLVLTAAHCVYDYIKNGTLDQIEVVAGEHDLKIESGHEQVVQIHEAFVHKNYESKAKDDDIALLLLQTELTFNKYVRSIPIPKNVASTVKGKLSGWGRKSYQSSRAVNVLHNINLTIYEEMKCKKDWEDMLRNENKARNIDMTKVLCARHTHQGRGKGTYKMTSCSGDSGSPLTCNDNIAFLCGITSGSDRACGQTSNISGIFANVLSHFDWITDNYNQLEMRYNCPCNYFRCANEFCVNPSSLNNGINDCDDGSDEEKGIRELFNKTGHNYKIWDIEDTKYKCHYTHHHPERYRLISTEYLCDGILNCPANHPNICNDYKKNISICSSTTQTGTRDPSKFNNCIHRTDETNCIGCKNGSIKCLNENKCIRPQKKCNGVPDCKDGSDEMNCDSCSNSKSNFHCSRSKTCIKMELRCDSKRNCTQGEDEENCNKCKNSFLCSQEKKCIPEHYRCDARLNDCKENLDELNCTECVGNRFLCKVDQKCIYGHKTCDGAFDCDDESDEKNCLKCQGYSFHCKTENKCVHLSSRCDGKKDCGNNEDEKNCIKCSKESLFHCSKSRRCIEANLRCDGKKDCEYNEDEAEPCPAATTAGPHDDVYNY